MKPFVAVVVVVLLGLIATVEASKKLSPNVAFGAAPEEAVNILGGTDSHYDLSRGSTLPLIARPWGFNGFAAQTDDDPTWPGWWFHPSDRRFFGIRLTHQPSPWISDYGNFLIKAYMPSNPSDKRASGDDYTGYAPSRATFSPYYFATDLMNYGNSNGNLKIEFSPSMHGGMLRATFPAYIAHENGDSASTSASQLRRLSIVLPMNSDITSVVKSPIDGTTLITGHTTHNSGGVGNADAAFAHYFVAAIYCGANGDQPTSFDATSVNSGSNVAWVNFSPTDSANDVLTMRLATSFISQDQALVALQAELPLTKGFEALKAEAKSEWNSVLSRIQIHSAPTDATPEQAADYYSVFYSSLYRASLFPRQLTEFTSEGEAVHWSPYATSADTRVQTGPLSTDSGFWDAWNTVYPLLSLFHRPMLGVTMQGWVNAYKEGGWLPKWASPGYRGSMIGTMGDVSLADAIVKDIPGFDREQAYAAIRKDAFEVPPVGVDGVGRVCLSSYLQNGYVTRDAIMTTGGNCYEVVSRTLNYLQSDFAVAQAAQKLGYDDDTKVLQQRASNFSLLFDAETGFFRARSANGGKFVEPFDQYGWGGDYTESGPWQYRFYVPYNAAGLASLYQSTGREMCAALQTTMTMNSLFHLGGYGSVIHEQIEMADHCFGQYAHNNQPVHYMLYMHMFDGYAGACSTQGRGYLRRTLTELYRADADMYPGDEDNGEMAAWFVLGSLGLYAQSPGDDLLVFGLPLFSDITIDLSDSFHAAAHEGADVRRQFRQNDPALSKDPSKTPKKTLRVISHDNLLGNTQIARVVWNNVELDKQVNGISYRELVQSGGVLEFYLTAP